MSSTPDQLAAAIAALEAQRPLLGDAVVDTALAPLREKLAALREPPIAAGQQQLKQVSVLFVDVVGSTAIGQKLDPETIHAVMDGALERFTAVVRSHHGRVLQYTGDGMLAAFGSEEASEDDVESAIRAALGIVETARELAPSVRRQHGVPDFNVRVGVHTGRVLLGGGVDAEGSIRGATVNVAARMEQSAPPGRVRVSHDSWVHVRGLFDAEEQAPISVKGVEQPMRSWLIERPKALSPRQAPRGIEGLHTPMVGRQAELMQLRRAFEDTVAERRLRAVTVVGEAGLGKSRLLDEFEHTLDARQCWLLTGRAHPRSALQPHGLVRDMLLRHLQIGDGEAPDAARDKFQHWLAPLLAAEGEAPVHLLGQLIGLDYAHSPHVQELQGDDALFRLRAYEAAAQALRRLGEARPVVLVLDDLHWADEGSLEFIEHLMSRHRELPLLCLVLTRQTLFEHHAGWAVGDARHQRLDLKPLDPVTSRELAESLLQRITDVPDELRALLTAGAEGNPFYMEELVKMLIDDGVILAEGEGWRVLADKLDTARVPPTLTGVLQARLDALPRRERLALQQAAIVGHVFGDETLAAIDSEAPGLLPLLLRKQLVAQREGTAPEDVHTYMFHHHLLHQVTYDSVLKAPKREGHARVGAYWSTRAEVSGPQQVDAARCRALAEAQYHRCQADLGQYLPWFESQFNSYFDAYAAPTLRPLTEDLVAATDRQFGPDHPDAAKARTNLARVLMMQGDASQAEPLLRQAIAVQEGSLPADHPETALTLAALGGLYERRGDLAAAEPYYRRALHIREQVLGADHPLTLVTLDNLAKAMLELDRLDEAEALSLRVLKSHELRFGPEHPETAFALTTMGEVLYKQGHHAAAEPLIRRALTIQQRELSPEHPDTGLSMWHLAMALQGLQRHDEAEPLARRALELWESSFGAEHEWTAWGLISLAEIRLAQGDAAEAATQAERAARVLLGVYGEQHAVLASTLVLQARALLALGDAADAEVLLEHALGIQQAAADDAAGRATRELLAQASALLAGGA